jgi:hypothetical protein
VVSTLRLMPRSDQRHPHGGGRFYMGDGFTAYVLGSLAQKNRYHNTSFM